MKTLHFFCLIIVSLLLCCNSQNADDSVQHSLRMTETDSLAYEYVKNKIFVGFPKDTCVSIGLADVSQYNEFEKTSQIVNMSRIELGDLMNRVRKVRKIRGTTINSNDWSRDEIVDRCLSVVFTTIGVSEDEKMRIVAVDIYIDPEWNGSSVLIFQKDKFGKWIISGERKVTAG